MRTRAHEMHEARTRCALHCALRRTLLDVCSAVAHTWVWAFGATVLADSSIFLSTYIKFTRKYYLLLNEHANDLLVIMNDPLLTICAC